MVQKYRFYEVIRTLICT
uniref:Uncharacterized protein n=1 Tax=Anguilla anguilla TaxID=7936 RepID=A0A0E9TN33_ANGAN